jgi:TolB protein
MVAEADGSGSQTITGAQSEDRCPSWSPVAARIVYHRVGKGNIHSIRPSGEDDKRLTSGPALDYAPVWSPDGQKILFRRTPAGSSTQEAELFVMDRVGSDVHRLTDNQLVESQYAWSPDGKKIAYKTDGGGSPTLWVMRADGEFERAVAETSFGPARLTWAPGSRKIYFSRYDAVYYQDNDSNIWSARANGSDAHAVTSYPESEIFPSWGSTASTC